MRESVLGPAALLAIVIGYFVVLMAVSWVTGRKADNRDFFIAGRNSPWPLVAIGMIGASLSGVTFISIPGVVGAGGTNMAFSYMQLVLGYVLGYIVIANVLMPMYYRLNLVSIYGYLEQRFGTISYKTGAGYFILSRVIGAAFRLFLVAIVMHKFILEPLGVSFLATVIIAILLIWIYTFKGGIKTIVWTDTLQTICMLTAVVLTIMAISRSMGASIPELWSSIGQRDLGQVFFFEGGWSDPNNFFKQVISGALITIVMTGLDQDMMQKNLSCRNIGEAKKNMYTFSGILVFANFLFLFLGALLYLYAAHTGMEVPERTDQLYPVIALDHLGPVIGVAFILGLTAAAYSSADSALTALTTSFCVDFLGMSSSGDQRRVLGLPLRWTVHIGFSIVLCVVILIFNAINNDAVINNLFIAAGYTYGPLLGLYAFGMFTKRTVRDNLVLGVCLLAPVLSYILNLNSDKWLNGFQFGFLILAVNGILTFVGLYLISKRSVAPGS